MKSAKKIVTLLIFSVAVVFTGCSEPVGSLQASNVTDHIRVEPKRFVYKSNEEYKPADEDEGVKVFGVFKGIEEPIAIEDVDIKISETDAWSEEDAVVLSEENKKTGYKFTSLGIKDISISYKKNKSMKTLYRIYVGPDVVGDGDEEGVLIIINWEW